MTDTNDADTSPALLAAIPWPEQAFPLTGVRGWIAGRLNSADATVHLTTVYAAYANAPDQRVTARFAVTDATGTVRDIVFKGNRATHLVGSVRAQALVSRHCPGWVPQVITWDEGHAGPGSSRVLYESFEGCPVGNSGDASLLLETARTMAQIQNKVAKSGEAETVGLARVRAEDIPAAFETVYQQVEAHVAAWQTDAEGKLSRALGQPSNTILTVLEAARLPLARCSETVAALSLPNTIDHGDLHGGNALVQVDGTILIYDWETATVGCPLFSVEKLLVAAWAVDTNQSGSGPWGYVGGTPTQVRIRDAYLSALGRNDISAETFAMAMALAVVKEMQEEIAWARRVGWPDGNPEWTAQLVRRLHFHLAQVV